MVDIASGVVAIARSGPGATATAWDRLRDVQRWPVAMVQMVLHCRVSLVESPRQGGGGVCYRPRFRRWGSGVIFVSF